MVDPSARREIERAITVALSRKGVGGTVVVHEAVAELHGHETVVAIDLGDVVEQWNLLPRDMAQKRAESAASRLSNALREVRGDHSSPRRPLPLRRILGVLTVLVVGGVVAWWLRGAGFFGRDAVTAAPPAEASAPAAIPGQLRARRACEAARQRLYAGAEMGMDLTGWVVELWLARPEGEIAGPGALDEATIEAALGARGPLEVKKGREHGVASTTLALGGDLARTFFEREGRDRFVAFAEGLVRTTGARHGALYARCAHLTTRDVGAWYYGVDEAAAVTSLWLAAGAHAAERPLDLETLADGGALAREALEVSRGLSKHSRAVGARLEVGDAGGVSLRFPLGGPTRAAQLSRLLAEEAGLP